MTEARQRYRRPVRRVVRVLGWTLPSRPLSLATRYCARGCSRAERVCTPIPATLTAMTGRAYPGVWAPLGVSCPVYDNVHTMTIAGVPRVTSTEGWPPQCESTVRARLTLLSWYTPFSDTPPTAPTATRNSGRG
jgi:hypothetical protein